MDSRRIEMLLAEVEDAESDFNDSVKKTRQTFRDVKEVLEAELEDDTTSFEDDIEDEIDAVHERLYDLNNGSTFCEILVTGGKRDENNNVYRDFKNAAIKKQAKKEELNIPPSALAEALDKRDRELQAELRQEYSNVTLVPRSS